MNFLPDTIRQKAAKALSFFNIDTNPVRTLSSLSLLLCYVVESLARRSVITSSVFFAGNLWTLLYSSAILFVPLSLCLLFKRRRSILLITACIILALGIGNCILLSYRTAPLTAIDFSLVRSVWSILLKYLNLLQILGLLAASAAAIYLLWRSSKRFPASEVHLRLALVIILCAVTIATAGYPLFRKILDLPDSGESARTTADKYGFTYCFTMSIFDRGIDKPNEYSPETIDSVLEEIMALDFTETNERPNIIFLQLESFFDVRTLTYSDFEVDPTPVFTALEAKYPSGTLTVPSLATGTANTEFEVLTGMSLDYFGVGEYPYQTVLQTETCESMAYNMSALGYTSHAIHNHSGDFYDRQHVFSNLGFDTFTSVEYMQNIERNPIGWARDKMLTQEILKALGSTTGEDFIYAISVQAHGQYPKDFDDENISAPFEEADQASAFEYYLSQIEEMDVFIGELIAALERYNHPAVLVLFGDHLPGLGLEPHDLLGGSLYETQYVIWNNLGIAAPDRSIYAYQLSAYTQSLLSMNSGLFTKLHLRLKDHDNYQAALELLEYDYLYGELEVFDGIDPYVATDVQMGAVPITVSGAKRSDTGILVSGRGFTEYSRVMINDREYDSVLFKGVLYCPDAELKRGDVLCVAQISDSSGAILSQSESIRFISDDYTPPSK